MRGAITKAAILGAFLAGGLLMPGREVAAADQAKPNCYYNDGGQSLGTCSDLGGSGYWENCDAGHPEGEYTWEDATVVLGCERH